LNYLYRKLFLSCAFFVFIFFTVSHSQVVQAAATDEIRIQVNDSLIVFPEAKPYIDSSSNLQVPLRVLIEKLGYQVDWSKTAQAIKVTLTNKQQTIALQTGDSQAVVDGKPVKLISSAQFSQDSVYVPLRFVTETFGFRVQWDANNHIAIIDEDGAYHAPGWYPPAPAPAPEPQPKPSILQTAYKYLGVPYVWGGASPNGFDCSGYVSYIFQLSGIQLPRTSVEMYDSVGTRVSDLQEGDLVFFAEGRRTSHVGIYLGNGQFISAASSGGVSVASLTSGYWGKKFVGAKRLI
jgi:peptidoglycan endopeptidase LytE